MLKTLDNHAVPAKKKLTPVTDVWTSLHMDELLTPKGVELRKKTKVYMESIREKLIPYVVKTEFPDFVRQDIAKLGINGCNIKGYGSAEINTIEAGAICYELGKVDTSIETFFGVHNLIGMSVIDVQGDEEQKARMLPPAMKNEKICCFGLTEPNNGSDATSLKTTAVKVPGGYLLNG